MGIIFVTFSNYLKAKIPQTIRESLDFVLENAKAIKADPSLADNFDLNDQILKFTIMIIGFALLMGVFMYLMRQTIIVMSRLIEYDLRKLIFGHYENMDISFFKKNKTGDMMSRISEDVSKVRMYLGPAILYGINLSALFVMVLYAMFKVNVTLTLYTLLPLPFLSISIYIVSSIISKKSEVIQRQLANLTSIAQEVYSGIRIVKSYAKESQFSSYFSNESQAYENKSLELARVNALFFPLMILMISLSTILTIYIGAVQVSKGNATPGNIAEFVIYINYLTWPFTSIGWIASIIQQAEASQKRINEFIDTPTKIKNISEPITDFNFDTIEFKDVSFTYKDTGIEALKNVNLKIKRGEKIAIIGKTASGKSTIADLILRAFDVTEGALMIDGNDIKNLDLNKLRNSIGYVPQDVFLFSNTIANNIKFSVPDATDEEVKYYAKSAAIHKDIMGLPEQYDTRVGERGVTLSGGQKQRISIARAFIKKPGLVILDDCLSAVDTDTEQQIMTFLKENLSDKTAIMITHRIHSLMNYDKIIVMDEGRIAEIGTHEQLILNTKGTYTEMYNQQISTIMNH